MDFRKVRGIIKNSELSREGREMNEQELNELKESLAAHPETTIYNKPKLDRTTIDILPKKALAPKQLSALDKQVGGNWYNGHPAHIQHKAIAYEYRLTPCISPALEYLLRYRQKNGKQDLEKAIHLIEMAIEIEFGEGK